jgi:carbon-monoxide dehydrogenase large subunit
MLDMLDSGKLVAASALEASPGDVDYDDGTFRIVGTDRTMSLFDVARAAKDPRHVPKDHKGDGKPGLDDEFTRTPDFATFPNGCHICELEIDEDTGEVEIVRYSVVDDVGTVLNPLLLKGQIVGGVAQGVGQILMEDIRFDGDGQILTGSFMDYAMPRATDISAVEVKSNPVPTRTNPLGVKGAGEAGCVGAMPAVIMRWWMRSPTSACATWKCQPRQATVARSRGQRAIRLAGSSAASSDDGSHLIWYEA